MSASGIGYDCHRFAEGRRLVLGGVEIPYERGLEGHSDADVVCHAIIDALLGASALGDIGDHFPDGDPRWKDADSIELLRLTVEHMWSRGFTIRHVDVTVVMEQPKLAPVRDEMRRRLSQALVIDPRQVSVKATTGERMGFVGREEGVAALAVATVEDRSSEGL